MVWTGSGQDLQLAAGQLAAGRLVLARVTGIGNRALVNLGPDDFAVDQSGRPREVLDVHMADYPIAVILDDSPAAEEFGVIRNAALRFIARIGQRAVAVGLLSRADTVVAAFDDDRAAVLAKVGQVVVEAGAAAVPFQAVSNAARLIHETGSAFSAIVVLSAQPVDPAVRVPGELLNPIVESGAAVHVITRHPPPQPSGTGPGDLLKGLAEQTHGEYVAIYSGASFAAALDRLADRLAAEVMIEYLATPDAAPGDVRVGVKIPGARVTGLGVSK
jgi:hypothetical protein